MPKDNLRASAVTGALDCRKQILLVASIMNLYDKHDIIGVCDLVGTIIEKANTMAVVFSPIDSIKNYTTPFFHANLKMKAYLTLRHLLL